MSSDYAIRVKHVTKAYQIYEQPSDRLKQMLWRGRKQFFREFRALDDVSFEVKKGETVGIIGRNGSGKSTLLQIICGTLAPTSGTVEVNGRVAALLELGAGFNSEFTGKENVYMNATILGLSKEEIDAKYEDIMDFADIGDFVDQPVKTYSSGMYVRLAFSVIAHVDADILVIDEALAVGDVFFTQKCMRYIRGFIENGGTLLFVSHDMTTVNNICQSAVMLFPGAENQCIIGSSEDLTKRYLNQIYDDPSRHDLVKYKSSIINNLRPQNKEERTKFVSAPPKESIYIVSPFRADADSFGEGGAKIVNAFFSDNNGENLQRIEGGSEVSLTVSVKVSKRIFYPAIGIMIKDRLGQYIYTEGTDSRFRHNKLVFEEGETVFIVFSFIMPLLLSGIYTLNLAIAEGEGDDHIQHHWIHDAIKFEAISSPVIHGVSGLFKSKISMEFLS